MSQFTQEIGVGFPGIQRIDCIDANNGYVRCQLKPWSVSQPGIDPDGVMTAVLFKTYSNAEFDALGLKMSRTKTNLRHETYDAQRGMWTFEGRDQT